MNCRHCSKLLINTFIDLGSSPPSNAYLTKKKLNRSENWYPLKVFVCDSCWLVQTKDFVSANQMFSEDYFYFSSYSSTWLKHAKNYVNSIVKRFQLNQDSVVAEVASNDGYLLQYVQKKDIQCYGIEPTASTAKAARKKGIEVIEEFFGVELAIELSNKNKQVDLLVANNVLAHVPDINDFVKGFSILLKSDGVATFEFPYLVNLIEKNQFDTIYHEHYSYLSLSAVKVIFELNNLRIFDVELLETHGGSLRVFAERIDNESKRPEARIIKKLLMNENSSGYLTIEGYSEVQSNAEKSKNDLLEFLLSANKQGKNVYAYGAAAKGNTFINFAGIRSDLLKAVADGNPKKQGKFLPGSRIPIISEDELASKKPDYVIILPWNLKDEITTNLSYMREWGCKFVLAVPVLKIL
jgi:SAM-dependent methyltransferase